MSEAKTEPKMSAAKAFLLRKQERSAEIPQAESTANAPLSALPRSRPVEKSERVSPAKQVFLRKSASLAAVAAGTVAGVVAPERPAGAPGASEYDILKAQLGEDLDRLSAVKSVNDKIALKRELIAAYDAHIIGVLEAAEDTGKATQDIIFVEIMIWRFDIGDWGLALDMAAHVIKFGLKLPERHKRTPETFAVEEPAEAGLAAIRNKEDFDLKVLQRVVGMAQDFNINDQVRAKLHKAIGLLLARQLEDDAAVIEAAGGRRALAEAALENLQRAMKLFKDIGVKKEIDRLGRIVAQPAGSDA